MSGIRQIEIHLTCDCGETASHIFFDHEPNRLVPVCDRCLQRILEAFGEVNIDVFDISDPLFLNTLIREVNEQFKWYDDMLKRLRDEIARMRKGRG